MGNDQQHQITKSIISLLEFIEITEVPEIINFLHKHNMKKMVDIYYLEKNTNFQSRQIRALHRALKTTIDNKGNMQTLPLIVGIESFYHQISFQQKQIEMIDFVLSGLPKYHGGTNTSAIITKMITKAKKEIIVFAYTFHAKELIFAFRRALKRGCKIQILGEESAINEIVNYFIGSKTMPEFYVFKGLEFYKNDSTVKHVLMHAKTILVDRNDILVTSANLSFSGLRRNVEFGLRLQGEKCEEAYVMIKELLNSGLFKKLEP